MITINMDKAKVVAHDIRRCARAAEFAPLDLKATIPYEAAAAEAARQAVRNKYTAVQASVEAALSVEELKTALRIK
jgi:hypothetical protein